MHAIGTYTRFFRALLVVLLMLPWWTWNVADAASVAIDVVVPQHRVALVIGNSRYSSETWQDLQRGPELDAALIAGRLRALSFRDEDLIVRTNLDRRGMLSALEEFRTRLRARPGALGIVYFSGHGAQAPAPIAADGVQRTDNYLIPVGTDLKWEDDAAAEAVSLDRLKTVFRDSGALAGVIVLDACRNNALLRASKSASSKGLERPVAGDNLLIAFATAAGRTAQGRSEQPSEYTELLATELGRGALPLTEIFRNVRNALESRSGQAPELEDRLRRPVALATFTGVPPEAVIPSVALPPPALPAAPPFVAPAEASTSSATGDSATRMRVGVFVTDGSVAAGAPSALEAQVAGALGSDGVDLVLMRTLSERDRTRARRLLAGDGRVAAELARSLRLDLVLAARVDVTQQRVDAYGVDLAQASAVIDATGTAYPSGDVVITVADTATAAEATAAAALVRMRRTAAEKLAAAIRGRLANLPSRVVERR